MQVNKNCSAQDLLAILQDHYDQFNGIEEQTLGVRPNQPSAPNYCFKRKKKKSATDPSYKYAVDKLQSQNKHFNFFVQHFEGMEDLLRHLDDLNKTCDREPNKTLKEVCL